ncbi:MAG: DUF59 domain-containing protein [Thermobispora bispora]|nr:DUF59 domain-containing protein [Thermobispora bispora]
MTTQAVLTVCEKQARVVAAQAEAALAAVRGLRAPAAVARLRFGPGRTCEPVARVIDRALADADRAGIDRDRLIVVGGSATPAEDIVRVRRKAHGKADWISSATSDVRITLQPEGLRHVAEAVAASAQVEARPADPAPPQPAPADVPADPAAAAVREALYEVLDPDLGVNIVDLGFVRNVAVDGDGVATITMTLTSAACPLTQVMEDQIRDVLTGDAGKVVADFRIEWVWQPAWRPSDISPEGREQLYAIGFTNF